jgi:galactitol-specific phosphotransferase system IIC component
MQISVAVTFFAVLLAFAIALLISQFGGRYPIARMLSIGLVAVALVLLSLHMWIDYFHEMANGTSSNCSKAGACWVARRDESPVLFWLISSIKGVAILFISFISFLGVRAAIRRGRGAA